MRKEFSAWSERYAKDRKDFIFLTGDLGYAALENVREAIGERFVNAGVAEQNMVSMAAGMARESLSPLCYSIAPFAVFRPCEQIRVDVCLHKLNVKIVGNGGGYGYGIMGATHHALEDFGMLSSFQHMVCYVPICNEDVGGVATRMMERNGPGYLRLGFGTKPADITLPEAAPWRQLVSSTEIPRVTVVGIGPVLLNAISALRSADGTLSPRADVFAVSEMPLAAGDAMEKFLKSVSATGRLLIIEEHVERGGLGEAISLLLLKKGISPRMRHLCAQGYPNERYGSQSYHQKLSRLDSESVREEIGRMIES